MLSAFFSRNEPNARAKISDDFTPLKTRINVFANPVWAMQRFHFMRENYPRANFAFAFPSRRERTRKAAKSSSHFAPKSLSFNAKESLGGKGKNRSRTSNKNERARTSSHICDARFMLIFIVREKRHKNYSQRERESFARKRSNDVPFCVRLRKMWFLL